MFVGSSPKNWLVFLSKLSDSDCAISVLGAISIQITVWRKSAFYRSAAIKLFSWLSLDTLSFTKLVVTTFNLFRGSEFEFPVMTYLSDLTSLELAHGHYVGSNSYSPVQVGNG